MDLKLENKINIADENKAHTKPCLDKLDDVIVDYIQTCPETVVDVGDKEAFDVKTTIEGNPDQAIFRKTSKNGAFNPPIGFFNTDTDTQGPMSHMFIKVTMPTQHMRYLIGLHGCNFRKLSKTTNTPYIWYHVDKNLIEIFGAPMCIAHAATLLKEKMTKRDERTFIPITVDSKRIEHALGPNHNKLKVFAEKSKSKYIIYHRDTEEIEIKGSPYAIKKAIHLLRYQMTLIQQSEFIQVGVHADQVGLLIGKAAAQFNKIKEDTGVTHIVYHANTHEIQLQGTVASKQKASLIILNKMEAIKNYR
jgi:phosphate starvation-inducible protein PhoH